MPTQFEAWWRIAYESVSAWVLNSVGRGGWKVWGELRGEIKEADLLRIGGRLSAQLIASGRKRVNQDGGGHENIQGRLLAVSTKSAGRETGSLIG